MKWRPARASDLDFFPQETHAELLTRFVQKNSLLAWPGVTFFNDDGDLIAVIGCCLPKGGAIEIWGLFQEIDRKTRTGAAIARFCRAWFPRIAKIASESKRAIVCWIADSDVAAARFAAWLGFAPTGEHFVEPVTNTNVGVWKWTV